MQLKLILIKKQLRIFLLEKILSIVEKAIEAIVTTRINKIINFKLDNHHLFNKKIYRKVK
jgi:hypothetical protein